jgi:hypothetical protein
MTAEYGGPVEIRTCQHCGAEGWWDVYRDKGLFKTSYSVRCRACGVGGKVEGGEVTRSLQLASDNSALFAKGMAKPGSMDVIEKQMDAVEQAELRRTGATDMRDYLNKMTPEEKAHGKAASDYFEAVGRGAPEDELARLDAIRQEAKARADRARKV